VLRTQQGTLEVVGALAHEDPAELTEEDLEYIGEYLGDVAGEDERIDKRELAEELYWGLEWAGAVDDFFIGSAILDELDRDGNGAADLDEVAAVRDEVEGFVTTFGGEDGVQEDELWDFVDGYYMTLDIRGTDWENDMERAVTSDEVRAVGDELQRAFGEAAGKIDALGEGVVTEEDIWNSVGAFYMLDVNEDGQVTTDDLDELEAGAAEFLGAYDNDGNGELNYIELYAATLHEAADRWEDDWEDDWEEGDWEEGDWEDDREKM